MKASKKTAIFFSFFIIVFSTSFVIYNMKSNSDKFIESAYDRLLQEAIAHYNNMVNTRLWNANHDGVYAKENENFKANPYLKDNFIYSKENQKLIKINPAFMTREISEIANKNSDYFFKITSLKTINPKNTPDEFEKQGLLFFEKNSEKKFYYNIDLEKGMFNFLGALKVEKSCLQCHENQGYKIGDIRGGLRVSVPTKTYSEQVEFVESKRVRIIIIVLIFAFIVFFVSLYFINAIFKRQSTIEYLNKNLENKVQNRTKNLQKMYDDTIWAFINIIEQRDTYTAGHTLRVAKYCKLIAKEMNLESKEIEKLEKAAILHDIGKVAIPDAILLKPTKLTDIEYALIKQHSEVGYDMLMQIDMYKDLADIIRYHHSRYDGKGYPQTVSADDIPFISHILIVADAFDAMTTNRIYKSRKSVPEALKELEKFSAKQFHPDIVKSALKCLKNVKLEDSSQLPITEIEEKRFVYFFQDSLTQLYNEDYLQAVLSEKNRELKFLFHIELLNFSEYNKIYGWNSGNEMLKKISKKLQTLCNSKYIFRYHGDDFIVLKKEVFDIENTIKTLKTLLKDTSIKINTNKYDLTDEKFDINNLLN